MDLIAAFESIVEKSFGHDYLTSATFRKTLLVLTRRKHAVGIITEPAKRFSPHQPSEEGKLVAKGIGNWMCCNQTRTLGEVPTILNCVSATCTVNVRELP